MKKAAEAARKQVPKEDYNMKQILTKDQGIAGFKGFDKDLKCRGFQFEIGKQYHEDEAEACSAGFHFCLNPAGVLSYYDFSECNRFAKVIGWGTVDDHDGDSKIA